MARRVVVTGIGAVCSLGHEVEAVWAKVLNGSSGISFLHPDIVSKSGGAVKVAAFVDENLTASFSSIPKQNLSKFSSFALIASEMALSHAKLLDGSLNDLNRNRIGVAIASGMGSLQDIVESDRNLLVSYKKLSPYFVPKVLINMAAGQVSIRHGFKGPLHSVATACAAGSHAIGDAYNFIRLGYADMMLAGGTEASIDPLSIAGFSRMKALTTNASPEHASRPFDTKRDGFVIGEGSCVLVLEELCSALRRGATIIAEVGGYGLSADAHHATAPEPSGDGARRSMMTALQDAKIEPNDVGYINAHATSTPMGDAIEAAAIDAVFGKRTSEAPLFVSSTKGATGHLLGAAGALESAFCCLALRDQKMPPTLNLDVIEHSSRIFSHIPNLATAYPAKFELNAALNNSFGFGGVNASLIFKRFHP